VPFSAVAVMTSRPVLPTPLVSTGRLAKHLGDPDLRVLDATAHLTRPKSGSPVRWSLRPGLDDYLASARERAGAIGPPDGVWFGATPKRESLAR
jgi:hypothetical protein